MRSLLATGPAGVSSAFTQIARNRVKHANPKQTLCPSSFFYVDASTGDAVATKSLWSFMARARARFGIGLGFESLAMLVTVIHATLPLRWEIDTQMEDDLATIDGDIAQAIQSCKEQIAGDNVSDFEAARCAVRSLKFALLESQRTVESWGGEFAFERGMMSVEGWKF